ncbi:uncharacterized protein F4822DRAFT_385341 [Hypoxylon trugodes]|uniref:uncharacterized protein n=1 Tax=Hypoxylon trugodes TaxID=326681 RepID=UPI00219CB294|nr:uncharacterized protein F4822DRAFT_385341 [Hypoxylon trugodes]KAI1393642.1 hypothetical protein F4822DRAFT_385341 [Hypoxylon trugodes]
MAPIPVYTDSPIASKPSGVTPQTAAAPSTSTPTATRSSPTSANQVSYPSAQPGAAPSLPTPTTAASQAYTPPQPTQTHGHDGPPPPQPGAVPVPSGAAGSNIPPPPKAGEKYQPPQQAPVTQPASIPYPPQMSIPPPTTPYATQQRGTSTATAPIATHSGQGPTAPDGSSIHSLAHPPGYHQNTNASELDRYQRSAIQQSELENQTGESGGVWDAAKKWAQQTGEKLAAAENEVWKKINKE